MEEHKLKVYRHATTDQLFVSISRKKLGIDKDAAPTFLRIKREDLDWE